MRYRKNAQLLASDVADLLRERGIPVIPQALDVGDVDAEAVRLGDSVELAELGDGTFMVSVNRGRGNWELTEVVFDLEEAADVAAACYGRGSRMEANAALKTRAIGNCPVCEGDFRLNKGRMVHHGYKRPGWGMIVGDCFGVGHLAYELSAEGCEAYLQACEESLPGLIEHLEKLERGEIEELTVERWVHSRQKTEYVTVRARSESASERLEFGDALRRNIRLTKKNIDQVKSEIERMEKRIAAWSSKPVRSFEEYEAAQRTAPERLKAQAEREAKRDAKAEKARLLEEKRARWDAERLELMDKYKRIFASDLTRDEAARHWREMHKAMDKKSYLHFYPKWLDMYERFRELGLARQDHPYEPHYAYPDGTLR